jgi:hypothetical protein
VCVIAAKRRPHMLHTPADAVIRLQAYQVGKLFPQQACGIQPAFKVCFELCRHGRRRCT